MIFDFIYRIPLGYYAFSGFVNFFTSICLSVFLFVKNPRLKTSRLFALFCLAVAQWSFFYFLWLSSKDLDLSEFYLRTCMIGVIFIPSLFTHFVVHLLDFGLPKRIIAANYLISLLLSFLVYSPLFAYDGGAFLVVPYWAKAGLVFPIHLLHFGSNVLYSQYKMARALRQTRGITQNQIKYVFIGTAIGYLAGVTNYFSWYRIPIPPVPNILISLYVVSVAYAIFKYRLMDIRVVALRIVVLGAVYIPLLLAPVLIGVFFYGFLHQLFGEKWWIIPVLLSSILGPFGIYIYVRLKAKAEEILLREQRRYQQTLLQASQGMTLIKELDRLLRLIVHVLSRSMRTKNAAAFLLDKETGRYKLKAVRYKKQMPEDLSFGYEDPIVTQLMMKRSPVVLEELHSRLDAESADLKLVESHMRELNIAVVVPSFIHEVLLGFIVLGEKDSGQMFTRDDLAVLTVLSNQSALAIENAVFYEETGKTLAQKFHDLRLRSLGKMGSDMSHQVNNYFNKITSGAGSYSHVFLPAFREKLGDKIKENGLSEFLDQLDKDLRMMEQSAIKGGEIAKAIMRFGRKDENIELKPVPLEEVLKNASLIVSSRFEEEKAELFIDCPKDIPFVMANPTLLENIFINLFTNACDAQKEKEELMKKGKIPMDNGYRPKTGVRAKAHPKEPRLVIDIEDNGIGMTKDQLDQIFIPFFTTKATSVKGTGLGLGVIRQMLDYLKGSIDVTSTYGVGTAFVLTLPIAKE